MGQTRSSQSVDIQARVKGTLLERPFDEGQQVKEGAVLFKIDPAEFEANLLAADATLAKAEAERPPGLVLLGLARFFLSFSLFLLAAFTFAKYFFVI